MLTAQGTKPVRVIAVTGGKGGVGKTTVAVNLATALSQAGRKVLLLDGDLGMANADVLLGLTPKYNLEHVLNGERGLDEILVETATGVKVVPASSGITRMAALTAAEHAAIVREFASLHDPFDFLIVDTAAGISDSVLSFAQAAQRVLVVLRNEPASLTDAYALIKVLNRSRGVKRFSVLANMVRDRAEGHALFGRLQRVTDRYLETLLEYAGDIPTDASLGQAIRTQRTVMEAFPSSFSAQAYRRLAKAVDAWPVEAGSNGGLEFFFERLVSRPAVHLEVVK